MNQNEIKCPKCGTTFQVDEASFASIVKQVRDAEFNRDIEERLHFFEKEKSDAIKLAEAKIKADLERDLAAKDSDLRELKEREKSLVASRTADVKLAEEKTRNELNQRITELKSQLDAAETRQALAVTEAVNKVERERDSLKNQIELKDAERKSLEASLKQQYESMIKFKDEEIDRLKDLKARQSTKMIGESLEQHCENQFNIIRATGFKNVYFEKDNAVSRTGSKGDYIYREYDENGVEIISIMFEMKNESDTTDAKMRHKNSDFFKELNKDRNEKQCEYAVLVSMLEADSELYNTGIVDVSFQSGFPKMYVIRPQFFIPLITILRNAALNSLDYKRELSLVKSQNIDITDFEDRIEDWKSKFKTNSDRATKNFTKAIKEIEESIKRLENTRDALVQTVKNFEVANGKLDNLTVKKLTRGNATMKQKFAELAAGQTTENSVKTDEEE